jgi:hypothetical protein
MLPFPSTISRLPSTSGALTPLLARTRNPARCGARVAYGINASGDGDDGEMHQSRGLT